MQLVFPTRQPLPLFDLQATRRIEQRALAATPPHTLMRRAGAATARLALAVAPHARQVWIAVGPGNNGGDGLEAAMHLHQAGKQVRVRLHGVPQTLPADARDALSRAQAAGVVINGSGDAITLEPGDLAIDALLGIGASRAPHGAIADSIRRLNSLRCTVLAIDLPSGLHLATGQPLGGVCVIARHTLALLTLKPGLFTAAGRDHSGSVWLDRLDVDTGNDEPDAWLSGPHPSDEIRRHAQHKGSFGDVAVIGGSPGMTGAALLAARAAHAAGAGRVFVDLLDASAARIGHDPVRPELMFRHGWWRSEPAALAHATVVCGCGGGDAVREPLPRLLSRAARLVLDADALNALAADEHLQTALRERSGRGSATLLTPHPLEAARLLGIATVAVQADRWAAAHALAERFDCVIVLKGSGSLIAAPGRIPCVNSTGNAALASAGTGDVLAGWLAGTWAQQTAGGAGADKNAHRDADKNAAFDAAVQAVADHGAAAEPAAPGALRAGNLIEVLHQRLRGAA